MGVCVSDLPGVCSMHGAFPLWPACMGGAGWHGAQVCDHTRVQVLCVHMGICFCASGGWGAPTRAECPEWSAAQTCAFVCVCACL